MSWKTMAEITVFMVAAAFAGALLGFVLGAVSKAAKSAFNRSRKYDREKRDLQVRYDQEIQGRDNIIAALGHELEASERQTTDLIASHEKFRTEIIDMAELSLTSFDDLNTLRLEYDEVWKKLQASGNGLKALPVSTH